MGVVIIFMIWVLSLEWQVIIAVALLGLGGEWGVGGLLRRCGSGLGGRGCANGVGVDQANVECADIVEPTAIILVSINVERNIDLLA